MSNARSRKRKPGRQKPSLDPKLRILVVTEGEKTEKQYIEGFKRVCRNQLVSVEVANEHGVPMTLVRLAKQYKEDAERKAKRENEPYLAFDSVWCMFDIDDHPEVGSAQEMARDNEINLAISNPCIELWLLLHFRDNPGMQHRDTVHQLLKKHLPGYDKHVNYDTYSSGYSEAVTRAERLDTAAKNDNEPGRNPSTGVYLLMELIRTK